jgi:cobalt-zinc-cadmium efflux system membrane fusion protein
MSKEHEGQGNNKRSLLKLAIGGLVVAIIAFSAWRFWPSPGDAGTAPAADGPKESAEVEKSVASSNRVKLTPEAIARGGIETSEVAMQSFRQTLEVTGRLALNEDASARVGTFVQGRVTRLLATVGDHVKKGQALVYLHSHELLDARAKEATARAAVTQKEKALAYAKAELERAERLLEARAGSKREQARAAANVVAANAELEQARTELQRSSEWLEHLTVPHDSHDDIVIYAPMSGVVLKRLVSLGTVVGENSDLFLLGNMETLWAIAEVPESQAAFIRIGQPAEMNVPAFGELRFAGRVAHIGDVLNPDTRTVQVRVLINNPRGRLRPEMYARIVLNGDAANSLIAVPRDAVQELQGERVVFIALGDGQFEKRAVQTGREQGGTIEITSGLQKGDRIVTSGGFFIKSEFLKSTLSEE